MDIKSKPMLLPKTPAKVSDESIASESIETPETQEAKAPQTAAAIEALAFEQLGRSGSTRLQDVAGVKNVPKLDVVNDYLLDGALLGANGATFDPQTPLDQVPVVTPNNGKEAKGTVLHINGIMTDAKLHASDMQALANTGLNVIGVHNATKGMFRDLAQSVGDKMDISLANNTAVTTTADILYDSLKKGEPVSLVGHSQGGLVISNALKHTKIRLMVEDGLTAKEATEKLGNVKVETFGGAANRYTDGPEFIHHVNKYDAVPMLTGVGLDGANPFGNPGAGAVIHAHEEIGELKNMPEVSQGLSAYFARAVDRLVHGPQDIYFKYRAGQ